MIGTPLKDALESGDYVLTKSGQWAIDHPKLSLIGMGTISVSDAHASSLVDFTEQGKHSHDREYVKLLNEIYKRRKIHATFEHFFFPKQYCKPEWVEREAEKIEAEAAKLRAWLKENA